MESLRTLAKLRGELGILRTFDTVLAISPLESLFFKSALGDQQVLYVPRFVQARATIPFADDADSRADHFKYDLLFVGADNELNRAGLTSFIDQNREWLKRKRFAIAGKVSENAEVRRSVGDIACAALGYVEDLGPVYAASALVVSPVQGTGVKIKVIEALTFGKPVFASTHSMDGLPAGYGQCVFPLDQDAIDKILQDRNMLVQASEEARKYILSASFRGEIEELSRRITGE